MCEVVGLSDLQWGHSSDAAFTTSTASLGKVKIRSSYNIISTLEMRAGHLEVLNVLLFLEDWSGRFLFCPKVVI